MTTATLTVLFTDLANYTARVSRADREGLLSILREHEDAVRPVVERHRGRVVKNIGDSFLCLFTAAIDALQAALEIRAATALGEDAGWIRIAMTTGDVEEIDGDAFGEPVNLAARILAQTPAGEIWFGAGTHACMNEAEVAWEGIGRLTLKGIPGEQSCYRLVPPDQTWLPEALKTAVTERRLVRLEPDRDPPRLPPDPLVLLVGYEPGSEPLAQAMRSLPVLDPESIYLAGYTMPAGDRLAWLESGAGLVIGQPEAIDAAIAEAGQSVTNLENSRLNLAETMTIGSVTGDELEVVICGLALPQVPFSNVVASYTYDLLPDGTWATRADRSLLRVEVRPDAVVVHALRRGVSQGKRLLKGGESITLADRDELETPAGKFRFLAIQDGYAGVVLSAPSRSLAVKPGQVVELGRNPSPPGLAFPNRPGESNIRWCAGGQAAQARANGFTLDRVLAGRRQASIAIGQGSIELTPLHQSCPTYVLDEGQLQRVKKPVELKIGAQIVAGTTVVGVMLPLPPEDQVLLAETLAGG